MSKIVAYYRVSTQKQGDSGLGLEGQQATVRAYCAARGLEIVREYSEVESGKKADRPVLTAALAHAKRANATLVIAKLDRLARNVHFLSGLMASGVDFVACDNPTANRLTIHILAAVAEDEALRTSERVKVSLTAYKAGNRVSKRILDLYPNGVPEDVLAARSGKLGAALPDVPKLTPEARAKGRAAAKVALAKATRDAYADVAPMILDWRRSGKSYQAIADLLNAHGYRTRTDREWGRMQILRVEELFAEPAEPAAR